MTDKPQIIHKDPAEYFEQAIECGRRAEEAIDAQVRKDWLEMKQYWLGLAVASEKFPMEDDAVQPKAIEAVPFEGGEKKEWGPR